MRSRPRPDFSNTSAQLIQASRSTFDLYRAICSTAHKNLLAGVPSIGMQYANDCRWLAREARRMCGQISGKGKGRELDLSELDETLDRLQKYGDNVVDEQLVRDQYSARRCGLNRLDRSCKDSL